MDLNGKRVVIIGGTSGIGLATAQAAQREGAQVIVASSRKERVDQQRCRRMLGGTAQGHVVDIADETQVRDLFGKIGALDHLVFTAGEIGHLEPLDKTEIEHCAGFRRLCGSGGALMVVKYAQSAYPRRRDQ